MIVVQVHDHRGQRQPLGAALRALLRHLVQAPKQPFEMIGNQLAVLARQVIHAFVDRAEGARAALLVEVTAEALRTARRAGPDEFGQLSLLASGALSPCESPPPAVRTMRCDLRAGP